MRAETTTSNWPELYMVSVQARPGPAQNKIAEAAWQSAGNSSTRVAGAAWLSTDRAGLRI